MALLKFDLASSSAVFPCCKNKLENEKYAPKKEIGEIAQRIHNINSNQMHCCNNKHIQTIVTNTNTKNVSISATANHHNHHVHAHTMNLAHTCSHITIQLQSRYRYRPHLILNIDVCVVLAHQHASDVDMTINASQHKSRVSILTTYKINKSDHHAYPIHNHALHHHTTTTTSTTANTSDPNRHI